MRFAWSRRPYRIQHKVISPIKLVVIRTSLVLALLLSGLTPLATNYLHPNHAHAANPYNASDVLGQLDQSQQPSFTQSSGGTNASGLSDPAAIALDSVNHRLFVADSSNNRVLVFNLDSSNNLVGSTANYVLGQPNFTGSNSATTQNGMNSPSGLAFDAINNRLFVADPFNNRVLVFNTTSLSNGMNASFVLGEPDFTSNSGGYPGGATTQNGMHMPQGLAFDTINHRLFVADGFNNRVLVFNTTSLSNGMNASFVLGEPDFTSSNLTTTQSGMWTPESVAFDATNNRLFVVDGFNNRVLVFNTTSISNGMNASFVLGEPDFTSANQVTTQNGMNGPAGVTLDPVNNRLYVADANNNRVLVFNTTSISNGMNASFVLGEPDFTSSNAVTTQNGLHFISYFGYDPAGLAFDTANNHLLVDDTQNNRVLVFNTTSLSNSMNASGVLGQTDSNGQPSFTDSAYNNYNPTAINLKYPQGTSIDTVHHRLFVVDASNNRVLVYNLDSSNNLTSHTASYVLGQSSFTTNIAATTQSGMNSPEGVAFDSAHNRLFVADNNNNRVLVYDLSAGITNGMNMSYVLGEPDFTTNSGGVTTQNGLKYPHSGIAYDPSTQYLYVGDVGNYRVMVFNTSVFANGMNASYVIGEPDFTSSNNVTTQNGLNYPGGIAIDVTNRRLFVADANNQRVLVFNTTSLSNGMNASYVLGQPDFVTSTQLISQSAINAPFDLAYDSVHQRLFAQDDNNNRIMVFDLSNGITNNMNAMGVIGQSSFSGSDYSCVPSASSVCDSEGLSDYYDTTNNRLYLSDSSNNRVLVYSFAKLLPSGPLLDPNVGVPLSISLGSQTQGTTIYAVTSGSLPPGLSLNTSSGVLSGIPTKAGTYSFGISLSDNNGTAGTYTDNASYSLVIDPAVPTVKAPNTGYGVGTTNPLKTLAELSLGAAGLAGLAYVSQRTMRIRYCHKS